METHRSEEPQPFCAQPSSRRHLAKCVTTSTAGWPVCKVQQVSKCGMRMALTQCSTAFMVNFPSLSSGNPLSLVDLVPLLQKALKDESSVTCKMACSALRVRRICASEPICSFGRL